MFKKNCIFFALLLAFAEAHAGGVAVIGHPSTPKMDASTLEKVFTGKLIEVGGVPVMPINTSAGNAVRARFLQAVLRQDDEKYIAYWTVRRYIGKGAPPKELASTADIISFVQATPGAIGYIDEGDVKPGMNVLLTK